MVGSKIRITYMLFFNTVKDHLYSSNNQIIKWNQSQKINIKWKINQKVYETISTGCHLSPLKECYP